MIDLLFQHAVRSGTLRGVDLRVLWELLTMLDTVEYRPVKQWVLAERLRITKGMVSRSMSILEACEYIQRGKKDGQVSTYRRFASAPVVPPAELLAGIIRRHPDAPRIKSRLTDRRHTSEPLSAETAAALSSTEAPCPGSPASPAPIPDAAV